MLTTQVSLQAGAGAETETGQTALLDAAQEGDLSVIEDTLGRECCEDLEARDKHGQTALFVASWQRHASVVERPSCCWG